MFRFITNRTNFQNIINNYGVKFYIPDILQYSDFDCGDSCTQAILAYYGEDINEIKLIHKLKTKRKDGTPTEEIIKYFERRGYTVKAGSMNIPQLKKYLNKKIPVILFVQAWSEHKIDYTKTVDHGHYVVACGYDTKRIFFEDPAIFGTGYLTYKELEKRWHGDDKDYLSQYGIAIWGKKPFNYKKPIKIK